MRLLEKKGMVFVLKRIFLTLLCVIFIFSLTPAVNAAGDIPLAQNGSWGADAQKVMKLGPSDTVPVDSAELYQGKPSFRFEFSKQSDWYIGLFFMGEDISAEIDLSAYSGGYLELAVKGENGGEKLGTGFKSGIYDNGDEINALFDMQGIASEWMIVSIPISKFIADYPDLKINKINGFEIRGGEVQPGKIWVADPKITMEKRGSDLTVQEEDPFEDILNGGTSESDTSDTDTDGIVKDSSSPAAGVTVVGSENPDGGFDYMIIVYMAMGAAITGLIVVAALLLKKPKKDKENES